MIRDFFILNIRFFLFHLKFTYRLNKLDKNLTKLLEDLYILKEMENKKK